MEILAFLMTLLLFVDRVNAAMDQRFGGELAAIRAGWALANHARELAEEERLLEEGRRAMDKALTDIASKLTEGFDAAMTEERKRRETCACLNCKAARDARKGN